MLSYPVACDKASPLAERSRGALPLSDRPWQQCPAGGKGAAGGDRNWMSFCLSFPPGQYDAVIIVGALSEGQVPCSVVPELLRVTKPGEVGWSVCPPVFPSCSLPLPPQTSCSSSRAQPALPSAGTEDLTKEPPVKWPLLPPQISSLQPGEYQPFLGYLSSHTVQLHGSITTEFTKAFKALAPLILLSSFALNRDHQHSGSNAGVCSVPQSQQRRCSGGVGQET